MISSVYEPAPRGFKNMTKVILARFSTRSVLNNDSICTRNTTFYKYPRQFALVVKERQLLQYKTDEKLGRSLNYILSSIFRETWM